MNESKGYISSEEKPTATWETPLVRNERVKRTSSDLI